MKRKKMYYLSIDNILIGFLLNEMNSTISILY